MNNREMLMLSLLRKNAREKLKNMSRMTTMPVSTIYEKMKLYESGLIRKHTTLLDFTKLGYGVRATILIKAEPALREELVKYLMSCKSVNTFFTINNGFDFFVELISREVGEVECFLSKLEGTFQVQQKQVHYITAELKREDFMSHPDYIKLTGSVSNI